MVGKQGILLGKQNDQVIVKKTKNCAYTSGLNFLDEAYEPFFVIGVCDYITGKRVIKYKPSRKSNILLQWLLLL